MGGLDSRGEILTGLDKELGRLGGLRDFISTVEFGGLYLVTGRPNRGSWVVVPEEFISVYSDWYISYRILASDRSKIGGVSRHADLIRDCGKWERLEREDLVMYMTWHMSDAFESYLKGVDNV